MHHSMSLVVLGLFSTLALAAPVPAPSSDLEGRSFKVQVQSNHPKAGKVAVRKAFVKFGWNMTADLANAVNHDSAAGSVSSNGTSITITSNSTSASETGDVTSTPADGDVEYISPVSIGGQTLNLDFDTGSADLWVFDTSLPAADQVGHSTFDASKSPTFQPMEGATWDITYGDGSGASGTVGTDTVNIGGATVTSQAVELATAVSSSFVSDTNSDGLVGLAFGSINTVKPNQQKTFFEQAQASLKQPLFTANLKHGSVGSYEFGAIDSSRYTGELQYAKVESSSGFWQFTSGAYAIGSNGTVSNPNASPAIADTGTSLLLADAPVVTAYYDAVEGSTYDSTNGGYVFPCSATLPSLSLQINAAYMATVPGSLLNFSPLDDGSNNCYGSLQGNQGQGLQIFGDVLFKSQFVVFSQVGGAPSLGFAPHA